VTVKTADFAYALSFVLPAISSDDGRPNITGAFLDYTAEAAYPGTLRLVATDGHRLNLCTLRGAAPAGTTQRGILFPRQACEVLLDALTGEETVFQIEGVHAHLHTPAKGDRGALFCAVRLLDASYPDFRRVMPDLKTVGGTKYAPVSVSDLSEAVTVIAAEDKKAYKTLVAAAKERVMASAEYERAKSKSKKPSKKPSARQKDLLDEAVKPYAERILIEAVIPPNTPVDKAFLGLGVASYNTKELLPASAKQTVAVVPCQQIQPRIPTPVTVLYGSNYWMELVDVAREDTALLSLIDDLSPTSIVLDTHLDDAFVRAIIMPMRTPKPAKKGA